MYISFERKIYSLNIKINVAKIPKVLLKHIHIILRILRDLL